MVYFHGTASETQRIPFPEVAAALGARVLTADRPGYGATPPAPGTTNVVAAGDTGDPHDITATVWENALRRLTRPAPAQPPESPA